MSIQTATQLSDKVTQLKAQRKNGELDVKAYYRELLDVLKNLADSLVDEVDSLDDAQIRAQIPLLIVLLDDQIRVFHERET